MTDKTQPDNTELRTALATLTDSTDWLYKCTAYDEGQLCCCAEGHPNLEKLIALFSKTIATKTREAAANEVYKAINMMDTNKTDYAATYHYLIERLAQLKPPTGEK